jgi:hypothetical protein
LEPQAMAGRKGGVAGFGRGVLMPLHPVCLNFSSSSFLLLLHSRNFILSSHLISSFLTFRFFRFSKYPSFNKQEYLYLSILIVGQYDTALDAFFILFILDSLHSHQEIISNTRSFKDH